MNPSFFKSRQSLFLLCIFLLLCSAFIYIYSGFVENKKEYLVQRNFRQLNYFSSYIQQRVQSLTETIQSTMKDNLYFKINNVKNWEDSIKSIKNHFGILITDIDDKVVVKLGKDSDILNKSSAKQKKNPPPNFLSRVRFDSKYGILRLNLSNRVYNRVHNHIDSFFIHLSVTRIGEYLELKKKQKLFDDYFFATSEGDTIFQPVNSMITISRLSNLTRMGQEDITVKFGDLSSRDEVAVFTSGSKEFFLFIHPINLLGFAQDRQSQWTICGIIAADKFRAEYHEISTNIILLFILIVMLIILAWPILKIRFISCYGHIRITDILFSFLSIMFISAIITFTFVDLVVMNFLNQKIDDQLKNIAGDIQKNLLKEISFVSSELDNANDGIKGKLTDKEARKFYFTPSEVYKDSIPKSYRFYDLVHWSDSKGEQQYKLLARKKITPYIYIGKRDYFQSILSDDLWKKIDGVNEGIYIQPTISYNTGDFSVSLSKKCNIPKLTASVIDFLPVSISEALLPQGFSFSIINDQGLVLFSSNKDRNLMENLFIECDDADLLNAAVKVNIWDKTTFRYWGKDTRAIISPVKGIPWYIVVMYEKDYLRKNNLETISASFLQFIIFLLPFVLFLIVILVTKPSGRNWIWPGINEKFQIVYKKLFYCFVYLAVILLLLYFFINDQTLIYAAVWLFPHSSLILFIIVALLTLQKPNLDLLKNKEYSYIFAFSVIALDFLLVVLIFYANKILGEDDIWWLLFFWFFVTVAGCFFLLESMKTEKRNNTNDSGPEDSSENSRNPYDKDSQKKLALQKNVKWYGNMLTVSLILFAVLPAIGFFKITYQTQIRTFIRQAQIYYSNGLEKRIKMIKSQYDTASYYSAEKIIKERQSDKRDIYISSFYETNDTCNDNIIPYHQNTWFNNHIFHDIIPQIGRTGVMSKVISHELDNGSSILRNYPNNQYLILNTNIPESYFHPNIKSDETIKIISKIPKLDEAFFTGNMWKLNNLIRFMLYAIIIFSGLYLFYIILRYTIHWAFLIDATDLSEFIKDNSLITNTSSHILLLSNNREIAFKITNQTDSYIINIPDVIKENKTDPDKNSEWIILPAAKANINKKIAILNHFEYGFAYPNCNEKKLELLDTLIHTRNKIVIIISSINPLGSFEFTKPEAPVKLKQSVHYRWKEIFSGFISLSWFDYKTGTIKSSSNKPKNFLDFIKSLLLPFFTLSNNKPQFDISTELNNEITKKFHPGLVKVADELNKFDDDNSLLELAKEKTRSYHQFLWDSCSNEEKLVLLHLAQDKFVPFANLITIEALFRRGLIKRDPNIKPLNSLFTRFILEADHPKEEDWQKQESKSGWELYRIPILLIFFGIIIFLFTTQSKIYTSTLTIVPAIAALIPAILKLFGLFQPQLTTGKETD